MLYEQVSVSFLCNWRHIAQTDDHRPGPSDHKGSQSNPSRTGCQKHVAQTCSYVSHSTEVSLLPFKPTIVIGYEVATPFDAPMNQLTSLEPVEHGKRRRVWDRAFTPAAIKSYNPMLHARVSQLVAQLELRVGQPLDIAEWLGFMTVDFMGDFAFASAFDCTKAGKDTLGLHELGAKALGAMETAGTMPWLRPIVLSLPMGTKIGTVNELALDAARKRQAGGSQIRDLFHYLVCLASLNHSFERHLLTQCLVAG
jgi:hypothetical protein